jgi:chromosomal replication initiation ATPase DnaA
MRGQQIIHDVMVKYKIGEKDFFGRDRSSKMARARGVAARRLRAAGFSVTLISRLIRRDRTTISYHLYPKIKARKRANYMAARSTEAAL